MVQERSSNGAKAAVLHTIAMISFMQVQAVKAGGDFFSKRAYGVHSMYYYTVQLYFVYIYINMIKVLVST